MGSGCRSTNSTQVSDQHQEAEAEYNFENGDLKAALISIYGCVESLMNVLPTIDSCCNEQSVESRSQADPIRKPHDTYVSDKAQPFVNQILDKFPSMEGKLAQRSGQANWERYLRLRSLQGHLAEGPSQAEELATRSIFQPFTEFQDSGLGSSLPATTIYAKSNASHASFMSTQSAHDRRAFRVPQTPKAVLAGMPFECEICHSLVSGVKNRVQWK